MNLENLSQFVPAVYNYPRKGVIFRDISPLLNDEQAREFAFERMADVFLDNNIDVVVGLDARGFIFGLISSKPKLKVLGQALASRLGSRFVMFRKPSKLPGEVESVSYSYEYSSGTIECGKGLIRPNDKVLIVDDVLATGGSIDAATTLVSKFGAEVVGISVLAEIVNLKGRDLLDSFRVESLLKFDGDRVVPVDTKHRTLTLSFVSLRAEDKFVILSHPSMQCVANDIIRRFPDMFIQGRISWKRFPDTYPNVTFDAHILNGAKVVFIGSLYDQEKFIEQVSIITILPRQFIKSLDIIFPYFAPGTMERVEEEGILATAEPVAKLLSSQIPCTKTGPAIIHFLDIHAPITRFYFTDNVFPQLHTHVPKVLNEMRLMSSDFCVAFPDKGAYDRFKTFVGKIPTVICSKVREADKRVVKITDFVNWSEELKYVLPRHVLIIDDLVQSGGTLDECRKALKEFGFDHISASVTHAVFPNRCYKRFLKDGNRCGFHTFFITDSIPEVASRLKNKTPFRVLSIAKNIGEILLKSHEKISKNFVTILLASKSQTKLDAVTFAADNYFPRYQISFLEANSGVSSQPFGIDEILQGVSNRMVRLEHYAEEYFQGCCVIMISIENGIIANNLDIAAVRVKVKDKVSQELTTFTESVKVPEEALTAFFALGEEKSNTTVGKILSETKGYDAENWHHDVHGINRSYLIFKAIDRIFSKIEYC